MNKNLTGFENLSGLGGSESELENFQNGLIFHSVNSKILEILIRTFSFRFVKFSNLFKLMADYHCYPLWQMNEAGNFDPDQLPLSTVLKKHLKNWVKWYDDTLVADDPLSSGFKNLRDSVLFEEEGKFLWQQLQRELDEEYEVFYFSQLKGRIIDLEELKKAA